MAIKRNVCNGIFFVRCNLNVIVITCTKSWKLPCAELPLLLFCFQRTILGSPWHLFSFLSLLALLWHNSSIQKSLKIRKVHCRFKGTQYYKLGGVFSSHKTFKKDNTVKENAEIIIFEMMVKIDIECRISIIWSV